MCTWEVGAWNTAQQDRPRGRATGLWDSPFPALPPFLSVLFVCMCLCVCVYIYNNIYICLFAGRLWQWDGSWHQNQLSPLYLTVPLQNCCRQTILGEGKEKRGMNPASVRNVNSRSVSASSFNHSCYSQTRNCCLGTCCC